MSVQHESVLALPDYSNETQAMVQARSVMTGFCSLKRSGEVGNP